MTSHQSRPIKKIATLGLAGTVMTSSMGGMALANDKVATDHTPAECVITPETHIPGAPTEAEINQQEQRARDLNDQERAAQERVTEREEELRNARTAEETATALPEPDVAPLHDLTDQITAEVTREKERQAQAVRDAQQPVTDKQEEERTQSQAVTQARIISEADEAARERSQGELDSAEREFTTATRPEDQTEAGAAPQASDIETRIEALEAESAEIQRDIDAKNAEREELDARRTVAQADIDQAQAERDNAERAYNEAVALRDNKAQLLQEAEEALQAAQAELEQAKNAAKKEDRSQAKNILIMDEIGAEIERLKAEIAEQDRLIASLQDERPRREADQSLREFELPAKQEAVNRLNEQINALTAEIDERNNELSRVQSERQRLEGELEELKNRIQAAEETAPAAQDPVYDAPALHQPAEHIVSTALFRSVNGTYERVAELDAAPEQFGDYIVRATTDSGSTLDLTVASIAADDAGGFRVEAHAASAPVASADASSGAGATGSARVELRVPKTAAPTPSVYTSFRQLVEALNAGSSDVRLARDLYADELDASSDASAYITRTFTNIFDGGGFTIHGLVKPLFNTLGQGSMITNLKLADVDIASSHNNVGAVANEATRATITLTHVSGNIASGQHVGGLVAKATNSAITFSTMRGTVRSTFTGTGVHVGGLVGEMSGGQLTNAGFHGDIYTISNTETKNRIGGVAGSLNRSATATKVYAGGNLYNAHNGGQVGGLVGSLWSDAGGHGRLRNAVAAMNVRNGMQVHGDKGFTSASMAGVSIWQGQAAGGEESAVSAGRMHVLSDADAHQQYAGFNLPVDVRAHNPRPHTQTQLNEGRQVAYANYRKLLPYASHEALVKIANSLQDSDPLVTRELLAALPTVAGAISVDTVRDAAAIDGLILHFADHRVERRALVRDTRNNDNTQRAIYLMANGLPYTPGQAYSVDDPKVAELSATLKAITWENVVLPGAGNNAETENNRKGMLYLRETWTAQHDGLEAQLRAIVARELAAGTYGNDQATIIKKISDHGQQVLLGLAYINRWYNVDFDGVNLRDILLFRRDFYGAQETSLDLLIRLGSHPNLLNPSRNDDAYRELHYHVTKVSQLHDALDQLRQQFTKHQTFDSWFKATTKAYLVEAPSAELPDYSVKLSDRLRNERRFNNMVLPLLSVSPNAVWVMTHLGTTAFGSFEKYYNVQTVTRPEDIQRHVDAIKRKVDTAADKFREYYDMWYRIGDERMRNALQSTSIPVWDGFSYDYGWTDRFGPGNFRSVEDFYGPVGRWFAPNGLAGYSNRSNTWMVVSGMLNGGYDLAVYTHEQVHGMSFRFMLGGYGERHGSHAELYPTSFMQNPNSRGHDVWGFNQADHYAGQRGAYLHNESPDRFGSIDEINQFFKGYFDALYLADNLEADAILEQSNADKARLLMRLGNIPHQDRRHFNQYIALTEEELNTLNLNSIADLVSNELMIHRGNGPGGVIRDGSYVSVSVLNPLYGTAESSLGITGESAFKRNAYELWAAMGYHGGWVPYTSNKLYQDAKAAGDAHLSDTFVMSKIFQGTRFTSLSEYRRWAYQNNRERAQTLLKPIVLEFQGKQETFTSYAQLAARFKELMAADLANGQHNDTRNSRVYRFKQSLFSALMRQTQEFRTSIFTDGQQVAPVVVKRSEIRRGGSYVQEVGDTPQMEIGDAHFDVASLPVERDSEELRELRQQRDQLMAQIRHLQTRQAQMTLANTTQTGTADHLRVLHSEAQQRLATLTREIQEKRDRIEQIDRSIVSARETRSEQESALQVEQEDSADLTEMVEDRFPAIAERRAVVLEKEETLNRYRTQSGSDDSLITDLQRRSAEAEVSLSDRRQALARLNTSMQPIDEQLHTLRDRLAQRTPTAERLRALLALRQTLDTARVNLDSARDKAGESAATLAQAQQALAAIREATAPLQRALEAAIAVRDAFAGETAASLIAEPAKAASYPSIVTLLDRYMEAVATRESQSRARREQIEAARAKLQEAQEALRGAQQEAERVVGERDALLRHVQTLRAQREQALELYKAQVCAPKAPQADAPEEPPAAPPSTGDNGGAASGASDGSQPPAGGQNEATPGTGEQTPPPADGSNGAAPGGAEPPASSGEAEPPAVTPESPAAPTPVPPADPGSAQPADPTPAPPAVDTPAQPPATDAPAQPPAGDSSTVVVTPTPLIPLIPGGILVAPPALPPISAEAVPTENIPSVSAPLYEIPREWLELVPAPLLRPLEPGVLAEAVATENIPSVEVPVFEIPREWLEKIRVPSDAPTIDKPEYVIPEDMLPADPSPEAPVVPDPILVGEPVLPGPMAEAFAPLGVPSLTAPIQPILPEWLNQTPQADSGSARVHAGGAQSDAPASTDEAPAASLAGKRTSAAQGLAHTGAPALALGTAALASAVIGSLAMRRRRED